MSKLLDELPTGTVVLIPHSGDHCNLLGQQYAEYAEHPPLMTHYRRGWRNGRLVPSCNEDLLDTFTYALVLKARGHVQLMGCWVAAASLPWRLGNQMRSVYVGDEWTALLRAIRAADLGTLLEKP